MNLLPAGISQPRFKSGQYGLLIVEPRANHKRETKFFLVGVVIFLKKRGFVGRKIIQTGGGLFADRFACQPGRERGTGGQIGMRANQSEMFCLASVFHDITNRVMQRFKIGEWPFSPGGLRYPRRMLENRAGYADKDFALQIVQL